MRWMRRLRARVAHEAGFTMAIMMISMSIIIAASAAAVAATQGDIRGGGDDVQRKQAYAAAEAGIQAYAYYLALNADLWQSCTNTTKLQLNQAVAPGGARTWTNLPNSDAQYAIELLPANGAASCNPASPDNTFIDQEMGSFRIRSTGRASANSPVKRSLIGTFRKPGFADFVYFTDSESGNIQFASTDQINGPLHSNDTLLICPPAKFGRYPADSIETAMPGEGNAGTGWTLASGCSGTPYWNEPGATTIKTDAGTFRKNADVLQMPTQNTELYNQTDPNYRFKRKTTIVLNGTTMTVTGRRQDNTILSNTSMALPSNGLVYVSNDTGCTAHALTSGYPSNPYASGRDYCGEAWVRGNYSANLTIAAASDVVINGNTTKNGDSMLGFIANDWIRIYHPCGTGDLGEVTVEAALLALTDRFMVDRYNCGAKQGNLNVFGAIAQSVRGPVGTSGGGGTGYIKNYVYDNRMRWRTPPKFLAPENSNWKLASQQEQSPAQ